MEILGIVGRDYCQRSKNNRKGTFEWGCLVPRWQYEKIKTHAQYMRSTLSYDTRISHRWTYFSCRL